MNLEYNSLNLNEVEGYVQNNPKTLVLFAENWCPYCIKLVNNINNNMDLFVKENINLVIVSPDKSNTWSENGNTEWAINVVPTIFAYKNGKLLKKFENEQDIKKLKEIFC